MFLPRWPPRVLVRNSPVLRSLADPLQEPTAHRGTFRKKVRSSQNSPEALERTDFIHVGTLSAPPSLVGFRLVPMVRQCSSLFLDPSHVPPDATYPPAIANYQLL